MTQQSKHEGRLRLSKMVGTTMAALNGGEAQHVTTVEMPLEIKADKEFLNREPWRHMFPFALEAMSAIAGREDEDRRGLDMSARGDVGNMHVELWDTGPVDEAAFAFALCKVTGRPKLRIDVEGEAWVDVKVRAALTSPQLGKLGPYTNADVFVLMVPSQRSLDEAPKQPKTKAPKVAGTQPDLAMAGPWDSKEGHLTMIWSTEAQAYGAEAVRLGMSSMDEGMLRAGAAQVARLRLGMKAKRITISLADVQDVVEANPRDPLAMATPPKAAAAE